MYISFFKPIIDFLISLIIFILLIPLFCFIAIILSIVNKGNPFFFQKRPGRNEHIFFIIKFKTMNNRKDLHGKLLPDKERLTNFGKLIRKTSLDEIPQLLNVLFGHMSLVGPRPLLPEYLPLYDNTQKQRHDVKPGITGWAQVNGRNTISWSDKFKLDVWYVNNISFLLDIKIIIFTIWKVLKRKDINSKDSVTAEKFNGTN